MGRPWEMDVLDSMPSPGCQLVNSEEEITHRNDTSNWYFPLHFQTTADPSYSHIGMDHDEEDANIHWTWRGIHHRSPTHLQPKCLSLPSFDLPFDWIRRCNPHDDIIASAHGLLLIKLETRQVSEMDALRCPNDNHGPNLTRWRHPKFLSSDEANHEALGERWTPLMVYNPLRKEWRILPALSPHEVGMAVWDYRFVLAHLMVDEVENSYRVVLVFLQSMCVYNSREKTWTCHRFRVGARLEFGAGYRGLQQVQPVAWRYQGAIASVGRRMMFVDLKVRIGEPCWWNRTLTVFEREPRSDGDLIEKCGFLTVFEYIEGYEEDLELEIEPLDGIITYGENERQNEDVDEDWEREENGSQDEIEDGSQDEIEYPYQNPGYRRCSFALEVVGCMDNLFVIIPALLVQNWEIQDQDRNLVFMPLQFHIFCLGYNGDEGRLQMESHGIRECGVLRIQIPRTLGFINCKCDNCVLRSMDQQHPHQTSALWCRYIRSMDQQHPHQTSDLWCRYKILYHDAMKSYKKRLNKNWFRCAAKGSVIWVSVHDYLLQYDVVSGESKTEIVSDLFGRNEQFCGAVCEYTPNFHIKP